MVLRTEGDAGIRSSSVVPSRLKGDQLGGNTGCHTSTDVGESRDVNSISHFLLDTTADTTVSTYYLPGMRCSHP